MTELNTDKLYEWFLIDVWTRKKAKSDFLFLNIGNVDTDIIATMSIAITADIRKNIIYRIMLATGYRDDGKNPDPLKHFKRGTHFHAKPVKQYIGGDPDNCRWTLAVDTIVGKKQDFNLAPEKLDNIRLVLSKAPDFGEAIRRMGTTNPMLVFEFGQAVGAGIITKEGKQ